MNEPDTPAIKGQEAIPGIMGQLSNELGFLQSRHQQRHPASLKLTLPVVLSAYQASQLYHFLHNLGFDPVEPKQEDEPMLPRIDLYTSVN